MKIAKFFMVSVLLVAPHVVFAQTIKQWTLKECIDYAFKNNITIQTGIISVASSKEDIKEGVSRFLVGIGK